jgi:WD40 repeat protein
VAWSHNGKLIASGDESGRVWIFDVAERKKIKEFRIHLRGIQALSFDASDKHLLSTGKDDSMGTYDLSTWKGVIHHGDGASFYDGKYMPKSDSFITATLREGARLYPADGSAPRVFKGHGGQGALDCDINSTGSLLVTGGKDAKAILWSIPSGKSLGALVGHQDWVQAVKFSPNGKYVATSCGLDRSVKVWDVASRKMLATIDEASSSGSPLGWTADGKYLLMTDMSDHLQVQKVAGAPEAAPVKAKKKTRH